MANKKQKRKPVRPQPCQCAYNQRIVQFFEEAELMTWSKQEGELQEFSRALSHSPVFNELIEAAEEGHSPFVLASAVCIGWRAGQRAHEVEMLEQMVGIKEKANG
jgi:hypothetical protein